MNILSDREHAQLARDLIEACGGLEEVIRATGLSRGYLSKYQNVSYAETMPARVISVLETFCGRPIYSSALVNSVDTPCATGALKDLACDLAETATDVQALIRKALADGRLSQRELNEITAAENDAEAALERLRGARRAAEKAMAA